MKVGKKAVLCFFFFFSGNGSLSGCNDLTVGLSWRRLEDGSGKGFMKEQGRDKYFAFHTLCFLFFMPFMEEQLSPKKEKKSPSVHYFYFLFFSLLVAFSSDWRCAFTDGPPTTPLYAFLLPPRPLLAPLPPSRTERSAARLFNISPGCFIQRAADTCGSSLAEMAALRRYSSRRS